MTKNKRLFDFRIIYFKPTGKFYTSAAVQREFREDGAGRPYMPDVVAWIRGLRDHGGQDSLPGLSGEGWSGFILVDNPPHGFLPHLILPKTIDFDNVRKFFEEKYQVGGETVEEMCRRVVDHVSHQSKETD